MRGWQWIGVLLALLLTAGCSGERGSAGEEGALRVVVTTSIAGDVVQQVGGNAIALTVLMAPGQDPHSYEATAQGLQQVERAALVFTNGFHFEEALEAQIERVARGRVVSLSEGIEPIRGAMGGHEEGADPHVWWDVRNVERWATTAAEALAEADAENAATYRANAERYIAQLRALDEELRRALAVIPPGQRTLVTTHDSLGYFARAYDFEILGSVIPSFGTGVEPSASDLSRLEAQMRQARVHALFTESTLNDSLSRVVAAEAGAMIVPLYTDALGTAGSGADSYLGFMRTNVHRIVEGLMAAPAP